MPCIDPDPMPLVACPHCGSAVSDRATSCLHCGQRIEAPPPAVVPQADPEDQAYRCICGTWNRVGHAQCASCRRPLGQTEVRRRPVQPVHTGPLYHPIVRPDPLRERMYQEENAANTLGWVSVVCGVLSIFIFPVPLGLVAIACGIPAYLRGAKQGLWGDVHRPAGNPADHLGFPLTHGGAQPAPSSAAASSATASTTPG
jgi:hypothetical protein